MADQLSDSLLGAACLAEEADDAVSDLEQGLDAQNGYSIESPSMDYFSQTPCGRFYIPVCVPKDNDFKAYILFPDAIDDIALYNITGNISSTKIEAHFKVGNNQWDSVPYYGFEVSGDGMISVAYND